VGISKMKKSVAFFEANPWLGNWRKLLQKWRNCLKNEK